jgi:DNA gyrase/topoisomerase IV subunit B
MNARYNAADIEVLSGLDPVKRRPGMLPTPRARTTWRRK